jgi:hypothetical protein
MISLSWFRERKAKAVDAEQHTNETPVEFCSRLIGAFEEKANHNKRESMANFLLVTVATLLAPVFITLGDGYISGKIVPSLLSLTAAGSTGWLQLRQPQRLWSLYRTAQRELEDHRTKYEYEISEYEEADDRDKLLAERTANIALSVHYNWLPLVPSPENIRGFGVQSSEVNSRNTPTIPPLASGPQQTK